MADIEPALQKLLLIEGGYGCVTGDRGGETYCGISRRHHPNWPGWAIIDQWKAAGRPAGWLGKHPELGRHVKFFYEVEFWGTLRLSEIADQNIAEEVFDSAVNAAPSRAVRWLQQSLNMVGGFEPGHVTVDGRIGPQTIAAVNACKYRQALLKSMNGLQFMHYYRLVEADFSQHKFFRGWLRRVWEWGEP